MAKTFFRAHQIGHEILDLSPWGLAESLDFLKQKTGDWVLWFGYHPPRLVAVKQKDKITLFPGWGDCRNCLEKAVEVVYERRRQEFSCVCLTHGDMEVASSHPEQDVWCPNCGCHFAHN